MTIVVTIVGIALMAFTLRRLIFWAASLAPRRPNAPLQIAAVAVLVAARNEACHLPRLLAALDRLDYPRALTDVTIVNDGSTDATAAIAAAWAETRPNARVVTLAAPSGKAAAIAAGLAAAPAAEIVAVFDADTVPAADSLAHLCGAFADRRTGAACGYADPGRDQDGIASRYAALERWVTHLVTLAGKDRLGLDPAVIGAGCCIRTATLRSIGGFPQGSAVEDIALTQALTAAGWRTRWIGAAVVGEEVPADLAGVRAQRRRWSRGLMARWHGARGVEGLLVAAGYLDRLALLAGILCAAAGELAPWWLAVYAAGPLVVIATALRRARPSCPLRYVWPLAPMLLADMATTVDDLLPRGRQGPSWRTEARRGTVLRS